ncbi:DoxX family protein [Rhodococcus aetherivorans]|uniref:DoxX family protein n=1 Tax=Rhodococcus aetherivorans TaxID=191292 RepID=A0AA46PKD3_9NOCA|nr:MULTISPECIES: DoxX family protein [Rhodococcus]UYF96792.1 DoxX family protein [Rhodococcus aetherivorans]
MLRVTIGGTMLAHGIKHGRTIEGTSRWFESIGFRHPKRQARASAGVEILSGLGLISGLGTPASAAAVVATMGVATRAVHAPNGFFITAEGFEYAMTLALGSVAIVALEPGHRSVDRYTFFRRRRGSRYALATVAVGATSALLHTALFWNRPGATNDSQSGSIGASVPAQAAS